MYVKHARPTCTITPIHYVRTPGLHAQLPQFFMYVKHARPTCTITPILYVRENCNKKQPGAPGGRPPPLLGLGAPRRRAVLHTTTGHLNVNIC